MNKIFLALSVLALAGCGSESKEEDHPQTFEKNQCVTAGASYLETFTETNGDCGPMADEVINVPADGMLTFPKGCSGLPTYQGCSVFVDSTCNRYDPNIGNYTMSQTGKMEWAVDGSSGQGMFTVHITAAGYYPCTSTYAVNATRL